MGLSMALTQPLGSGAAAFSPATLFTGGVQGAWYDPSDLSSMWQDSAGTVPAAVDSPVGKINDKSGNGNHATQATTARKPILRQAGAVYYLEFDGVDDFTRVTFANTLPVDRLGAIRLDTWVNNRYIFDGGANNEAVLRQGGVTPQLMTDSAGGSVSSDLALGVAGVSSERIDATAGNSSLQINNGAKSFNFNAHSAATGIGIGDAGSAAGGPIVPSPVLLFGLITRCGTMSTEQLASCKSFLGAKIGIVL